MRNDFEQLLWLHSIGIEDVPLRHPINYFDIEIKVTNNDSSKEHFHSLKRKKKSN